MRTEPNRVAATIALLALRPPDMRVRIQRVQVPAVPMPTALAQSEIHRHAEPDSAQ
jgi:hypothetical protein